MLRAIYHGEKPNGVRNKIIYPEYTRVGAVTSSTGDISSDAPVTEYFILSAMTVNNPDLYVVIPFTERKLMGSTEVYVWAFRVLDRATNLQVKLTDVGGIQVEYHHYKYHEVLS